MIVYFTDRQMNIVGQASTKLPKGLHIVEDSKVDDVESGVASLEFYLPFTNATRAQCESCAAVGNYILTNRNGKDEFYTIIDSECDTKNKEVFVYAEDAGLDLLNSIVGAYEADKAYNIAHYINLFTADSGFSIGINEVSTLTRKLSWDGEETAAARVASVATQFDGCEISFSFTIEDMTVTAKKINIHKKRGADLGVTLRLNKDVDRIITKRSVANLATALDVTGGTPEDTNNEDDKEPVPITLAGYKYDDGDFYVSGTRLLSRKALQKWRRFMPSGAASSESGHMCRPYSYDTVEQKTLFSHALTELKKRCQMEVNYEVEIGKLPENARIGDRINIVDEAGELFLSTRLLKITESECRNEHKVTLGEHLIKTSGISQKVSDLAAQFAKQAVSSSRALSIANKAKAAATAAQEQANAAASGVENAANLAQAAQDAANAATRSAADATNAANAATEAVGEVQKSVGSLAKTVEDAEAAVELAKQAAETAQTKVEESATAAVNAAQDAKDAEAAAQDAQSKATQANKNAIAAIYAADEAKGYATDASTTAAAAKLDAAQAKKDIDALGDNLNTVVETMNAEYSRKTDLTEATADLQAQITRNAAVISSTVSMFTFIDETTNDAATQAEKAQARAQAAQEEADKALRDAQDALAAATDAERAAGDAQVEADTAQTAADEAKRVADEAQAALDAAKADLESVQSRADATEAEIAAAQAAVDKAQSDADIAHADAANAVALANTAQEAATTALNNANTARAVSDAAASYAKIAQSVANEAQNASAAQNAANDAASDAAEAQRTATAAQTEAENAKNAAKKAVDDAAQAVIDAEAADELAAQAADNLVAAKQRLADVLSQVDPAQEDVDAAQADVDRAQAAVNEAMANATAAAAHAAQAKINASNAQKAADDAQAKANAADRAAKDAQDAADAAQAAVDALEKVVEKQSTSIEQNAEQIGLIATKFTTAESQGGFVTKEQSDAAIKLSADGIQSTVREISIGGRNLVRNSSMAHDLEYWAFHASVCSIAFTGEHLEIYRNTMSDGRAFNNQSSNTNPLLKPAGVSGGTFTLSAEIKLLDGHPITNGSTLFYRCSTSDLAAGYQELTVELGSATDEWTTVCNTFTFGDYLFDGVCQVCLALETAENVGLCIRNIKLEKGNKATDWTPAPEDTAEHLDNVSAEAAAANTAAGANASIIELHETEIRQLKDSISTLVRNGDKGSLMTQTEDGWQFDIASLMNDIASNSNDVETLSKNMGEKSATIDALQQAVADMGVKTDYIRIISYNGQPCIELGETTNGFKLRITNTEIQFADGSIIPAYVSNQKLMINTAKVTNELRFGDDSDGDDGAEYAWKLRPNGHLSLIYKGGDA